MSSPPRPSDASQGQFRPKWRFLKWRLLRPSTPCWLHHPAMRQDLQGRKAPYRRRWGGAVASLFILYHGHGSWARVMGIGHGHRSWRRKQANRPSLASKTSIFLLGKVFSRCGFSVAREALTPSGYSFSFRTSAVGARNARGRVIDDAGARGRFVAVQSLSLWSYGRVLPGRLRTCPHVMWIPVDAHSRC